MFDVGYQRGAFFLTKIHVVNVVDDVLLVSGKIFPFLYIAGIQIVGIDDVGLGVGVFYVNADFVVIVCVHHFDQDVGYGLLDFLSQLLSEFAFGKLAFGTLLAEQFGKKSHDGLLWQGKYCCLRKQHCAGGTLCFNSSMILCFESVYRPQCEHKRPVKDSYLFRNMLVHG